MEKNQLEEVAAFLRQHRGNESNAEAIYQKLEEAMAGSTNEAYTQSLADVKEKASEYRKAKETGGSAWPEFENFVSEFEKAVVAIKNG